MRGGTEGGRTRRRASRGCSQIAEPADSALSSAAFAFHFLWRPACLTVDVKDLEIGEFLPVIAGISTIDPSTALDFITRSFSPCSCYLYILFYALIGLEPKNEKYARV